MNRIQSKDHNIGIKFTYLVTMIKSMIPKDGCSRLANFHKSFS